MYRFMVGEQSAYDFFGSLSVILSLTLSVFFFFSKRNSISLFSRCAVLGVSKFNKTIGKILEFVLVSFESMVAVELCCLSASFNRPFGDLVGTNANYFALLFVSPVLVVILSVVLMSNPIKQLDFISVILPFTLIFIKLSCFFNGCCWGIPWEHGLYNYHYNHPGKQVPVQAIEAFWALAIFLFFLWYRKKAKRGTIYPMYVILYSGTRFFSEFFRHEENVLGPFKRYHLLCMIGFVIGLILLLVMNKYGSRLSDFFEKQQEKIINKTDKLREEKAEKNAEEAAKHEAEMKERLEKAKAARAKASIKYKK